jgi:hypothetical protein
MSARNRNLAAATAVGLSGVNALGGAARKEGECPAFGPVLRVAVDRETGPQPAPRSGGQAGPGAYYNWDMNICHTWYWVAHEQGNVPYQGSLPSGVWDGENPPGLEPNRCDFCW